MPEKIINKESADIYGFYRSSQKNDTCKNFVTLHIKSYVIEWQYEEV